MVGAIVAGQVFWDRSGSTVLYLSADASLTARPQASLQTELWPGEGLRQPGGGPTAPAPTSTSAAITSSTSELVKLPVPDLLPVDPYAETPQVLVGRIVIPAIGLDEDLHQGMTLTAINRGPSHWPGTALPGQLGNAVIAGHRTTYSRPFHDLDQLEPGDRVIYRTAAGEFTYAVTGTEIVTPDEVRIADQTAGYTSTLFACHPPGSAALRIVTHLQLLDAAGQPLPPPDVPLSPVTVPRP